MQIMGPNNVPKSFSEAVKEIKNEAFLDLDFLLRAFQQTNAPTLPLIGKKPAQKRGDKEPKEKKTHGAEASLLRALVLEVLLEVFENVFKTSQILRRRLAKGLVGLQHRSGLFSFHVR